MGSSRLGWEAGRGEETMANGEDVRYLVLSQLMQAKRCFALMWAVDFQQIQLLGMELTDTKSNDRNEILLTRCWVSVSVSVTRCGHHLY